MMGRAMSLFMFTFVGLGPLPGAATGASLRWMPVDMLFGATGGAAVGAGAGAARDADAAHAAAAGRHAAAGGERILGVVVSACASDTAQVLLGRVERVEDPACQLQDLLRFAQAAFRMAIHALHAAP